MPIPNTMRQTHESCRASLAGLFLLCVITPLANAFAETRPNLLFVVADDQAEWAMGCSGHPNARTPNMDRLAREGTRLTNCFTPTPVCSPSRVSILTSRYGMEVGITDWLNPSVEPEHGLDPAVDAWPRFLASAGYRTGLIGKWHLGIQKRFHPSNFGYQYFMGILEGGTSPKDPELVIDGKKQKVPGFVVELLVDDALKFLNQEPGRPFALSVHFREPHTSYTPLPETERKAFANVDPVAPNPEFPKLDREKVKRATRDYLGSVAAIDRNLGRLLDELDRLHLTENTLVIYTSDHGYNIGHHGVHHKGNGTWILTELPPGTANIPAASRPNLFDTSSRVPALIRWPGKVPAGRTISRTVTHLDWMPTILDALSVELPSKTVVRGQTIIPLLTGKGTLDRSDDLYQEFSVRHTIRADMRGYRTVEWKLKRDLLNEGRDELYHIKVDPGETVNLAASDRPDARGAYKALSQRIHDRMTELRDPLLKQ